MTTILKAQPFKYKFADEDVKAAAERTKRLNRNKIDALKASIERGEKNGR